MIHGGCFRAQGCIRGPSVCDSCRNKWPAHPEATPKPHRASGLEVGASDFAFHGQIVIMLLRRLGWRLEILNIPFPNSSLELP